MTMAMRRAGGRRAGLALLLIGAALLLAGPAMAAGGSSFDVEAATRAYLDTLTGTERATSDAYFEGGYWLILWGTLVAMASDLILLRLKLSARFRDLGERLFKRSFPVAWVTALCYTLAGFLITLPWTIYRDFWRETSYDLLDLSFGAWLSEAAISFGISLLVTPLLIATVYVVIRKAPRTWWLWGSGVAAFFVLIGMAVGPVYIAPLFNTYSEMEAGPLRDRLEAMAAKYDVPAEHIYVFDQSKQHKRISANVSGIGPTIRISLNDNLLERTTEPEIAAVMGHELGHYVLNHIWWIVAALSVLVTLGLFLASRIAPWLIRRSAGRWGVRDLPDPASMPVLGLVLAGYFFVMTPVFNTLIRINESQADAFGLDAAREPDGFANAAMRLSEYRKIEPGPIEEFLFFDHPSGATRVRMSMRWKAEHVENPQQAEPIWRKEP